MQTFTPVGGSTLRPLPREQTSRGSPVEGGEPSVSHLGPHPLAPRSRWAPWSPQDRSRPGVPGIFYAPCPLNPSGLQGAACTRLTLTLPKGLVRGDRPHTLTSLSDSGGERAADSERARASPRPASRALVPPRPPSCCVTRGVSPNPSEPQFPPDTRRVTGLDVAFPLRGHPGHPSPL